MIEIKDVSLTLGSKDNGHTLLSGISTEFPLSHFCAIIGPSGCGKTTLLKLIAGIAPGEEDGDVYWRGRNLKEKDFHASEIAYVPQFGIAHEELTVAESVRFAFALRVRRKGDVNPREIADQLLHEVGIQEFANQKVKTLSGGQQRRLALAMELTSKPEILLCDEVTSGLDAQSENEIVNLLMHQSRDAGRLVLSVTHSLAHMDLYDSVLVLCRGVVAYHGPPECITDYFGVENADQLYGCLGQRPHEEWGLLWKQNRETWQVSPQPAKQASVNIPRERSPLPGLISQFYTLLTRRNIIFSRSLPQIFLQLALIFGFPLIVTIFAWNGLPTVENLSMGLGQDVFEQFKEARDFLTHSSKVGSIVSGIVMFQVILLTLMGANNSGREIAAERPIFEKEKLAGLKVSAYVASKAAFLSLFVVAQSVWMGLFVHFVCNFPGDLITQLGFLLLVNTAITSICLAVSSLMRSAEQASLVSIYFVGFQLPLSGAVLALPDTLGMIIRPFISAYWGWSGILQTLKQERYYDIVQSVAQSPLTPIPICVWVLGIHIAVGLAAAIIGCERRYLS